MTVGVGTSGWSCDRWAGALHPANLPAARRLRRYAADLDTSEARGRSRVTSDLVYVRRETRDVLVCFNNGVHGNAARNARVLRDTSPSTVKGTGNSREWSDHG